MIYNDKFYSIVNVLFFFPPGLFGSRRDKYRESTLKTVVHILHRAGSKLVSQNLDAVTIKSWNLMQLLSGPAVPPPANRKRIF